MFKLALSASLRLYGLVKTYGLWRAILLNVNRRGTVFRTKGTQKHSGRSSYRVSGFSVRKNAGVSGAC